MLFAPLNHMLMSGFFLIQGFFICITGGDWPRTVSRRTTF